MTGRHNENVPLFSAAAYPSFYADPDARLRACLGMDLEVFFPDRGEGLLGDARRICDRCPLKIRCRDWAMSRPWHELYGVWGGMSQMERRSAQTRRPDECPRCGRLVKIISNGTPPRHKAGITDRWCR